MNNRRRAAFIIPSDRMGGAERVVRTVAEAAARSSRYDQVDVFILCWNRTGTLDSLSRYQNVVLHYTEARSEIFGLPGLIWFLLRGRFSLVFSSSTHLNALASLMRRVGLLRTERLVARESTVIFERSFGRAGWLFRGLYRLYGAQDIVVSQTARMQDSLDINTKGRLRSLLVTLPNPVDTSRAAAATPRLDAKDDQISLVWCGRLTAIKRPEIAVQVLAKMRESGRPARMTLIGDGPLRDFVRACADELGVTKHIRFTGHIENPCSEMAQCEIGLITSEVEGFPNVVLEMVASGVERIVTTNCAGGLDEIPGVTVLETASAEKFVTAIASPANPPPSDVVAAFLSSRSPSLFLEKIEAAQGGSSL